MARELSITARDMGTAKGHTWARPRVIHGHGQGTYMGTARGHTWARPGGAYWRRKKTGSRPGLEFQGCWTASKKTKAEC